MAERGGAVPCADRLHHLIQLCLPAAAALVQVKRCEGVQKLDPFLRLPVAASLRLRLRSWGVARSSASIRQDFIQSLVQQPEVPLTTSSPRLPLTSALCRATGAWRTRSERARRERD